MAASMVRWRNHEKGMYIYKIHVLSSIKRGHVSHETRNKMLYNG